MRNNNTVGKPKGEMNMLTMKKNHASDSRGLMVVEMTVIKEAALHAVTKVDDYWFELARVIVQQNEEERRAA